MTRTCIPISPTVTQQAQRIILTVQEFDDVEPAIQSLAELFFEAFEVNALATALDDHRLLNLRLVQLARDIRHKFDSRIALGVIDSLITEGERVARRAEPF